MGHKAKLLTSNFSWQRCFHIFTELRKSRLDAKIIMRHMLAQFLTFCKMSSRANRLHIPIRRRKDATFNKTITAGGK